MPTQWAIFWSTYLAAMASFGMILVTARSIFCSRKENETNRILQTEILRFQFKQNELNEIRRLISSFIQSFDLDDLYLIPSQFNVGGGKHRVLLKLKSICDASNTAYFNLKFALQSYENSSHSQFLLYIEEVFGVYSALISDIAWFVDFIPENDDIDFDVLPKLNESVIKDFRSHYACPATDEDNRIWHIIEKYDYNIFSYEKILQERIDSFESFLLEDASAEFILSEKSKLEKQLYNVTEKNQ